MVFSDLLLARRIEAAEAANARGCTAIHRRPPRWMWPAAAPSSRARIRRSATRWASGSTARSRRPEIDRLEAFFRSRGGKVSIELCPLADPGILAGAGRSAGTAPRSSTTCW
jgi:hypothetical protein